MKRIFILLFLLPLLSKAQVYQSMPQAGYGPVKRMLFDSVLTLPLGIAKLQNITGGRDTGQIRYNKADSSIYTYSGSAWRKVSGGSTGITAINSLTGSAQTLVTGTDSTDFKIVSSDIQHKFNLPTASATKRGALSSADWTTFNDKMNYSDTVSLSSRINTKQNIITNPVTGTGTANYLPKFTSGSAIGNSLVYDNATNVLVNTTTDDATGNRLQVSGGISASTFYATAGTASVAPVKLTAGTNLTTAAAGSMEYDATNNLLAFTPNTTIGRAMLPAVNLFQIFAGGTSSITTIANFFGSNSNIPIVSPGAYEIEVDMFYLKGATAGTVQFTFTSSSASSAFTWDYIGSPTGGVSSTIVTSYVKASSSYGSGTSFSLTTASLTANTNHYSRFKIYFTSTNATFLKIQATSNGSAITTFVGSYWKATRLPSTNIGNYAP